MRKVYLVPNLVTTGNLFCGFFSIISSCRGDYESAAWSLFIAAIFDALDGRIARLAKATSPFGVQYDSLSDLTSFGIAPAVLLHQMALSQFGRLGMIAAFVFGLCSALRLARFNVTTSRLSKAYFQGLPTPAAANLVGTYVILLGHQGVDPATQATVLLIMAVAISLLMVSSVAFPSFKEFHWRSRGSFGILAAGLISLVLILIEPKVTLFGVGAAYVLASLIWNILVRTGIVKGRSLEALEGGPADEAH